MHNLLARQLRRCFGDAVPEGMLPFVTLVEAAYRGADADRQLIEHSMDTVSHELSDHNRRMHEAVAMLEATIESTTDGLLVVDREGRMVRMNRKFAALWRIPAEILAARDDARAQAFVLEQLEEQDEFVRKVRELYANPEAESYDTLHFKDARVFERYSMPLRVNGATTGRVWSFRDVTSRLKLEDQLRQSQKLEAIGLLAGGIAHDFNNLLTVISGHAELLQLQEGLSTDVDEDLTQIRKAAARAAGLTGQLLAFSRKQILRPTVLDLNDVVSDVRSMLARLIGADVQIEFSLSKGPALITADRGQIEQVLVNLVVNARDAMSGGGLVTLRVANVELRDETRTRARGSTPGPHVLFSVSDTGNGIAPESLERIFEPFYTTKEPGKGTGLGLATVYGIVRQSGGFIEVDSVVGAGTTFELFFPAAAGEAQSVDAAVLAVVRMSGTETILVVEDEDALRNLLRRTLERQGYTVLTAKSGRDALALVLDHHGPINLVVTDVVMPVMGGPQFVKHLWIARPHVPVLYVSGYTDDEVLRRGVVQSETALLGKPFSTEQLARAVREILDGTALPTGSSSDNGGQPPLPAARSV